jgi:hypothetical protein
MPRIHLLAVVGLLGCVVIERDVQHDPHTSDSDPTPVAPLYPEGTHVGLDDMLIDRFEAPSRTAPLAWRWRDDLRSLGGMTTLPTGELASQDLFLDEPFGGRVILKRRSDYGDALDTSLGLRLEGPVDLIHRNHAVEFWTPEHAAGTQLGSRQTGPLTGLDAVHDQRGTWMTACDGQRVLIELIDLWTGEAEISLSLDRPATLCALLGPNDTGFPVLLTAGPQLPLERWLLDPEVGAQDAVVITDTPPTEVRTTSHDGGAVFAFLRAGRLFIFDRGGDGTIVGEAVTDRFGVAVGPDGHVLAAWLDENDTLWAAEGDLQTRWTPIEVTRLPGASFVSVGVADDEIAIAAQQGTDLVLARARRP